MATDASSLRTYADMQADAFGIPRSIFANLITTESNWNPNAVSSQGAEGIAQLMPGTAPNINRFDPYASLTYAAQLFKEYFDRFGSWELAAAAYNAGPGAVTKYNGVPPYPETQSFIQKIFGSTSTKQIEPLAASVPSQVEKMNPQMPKILFWAAAAIVVIVVIRGVSTA